MSMNKVDFDNTQKIYNDLRGFGLDVDVRYYGQGMGRIAVVRIDNEDIFETSNGSSLNTFISGVYAGYVYGKVGKNGKKS